jgi:sugar-specific transcriptional regulator TrmB
MRTEEKKIYRANMSDYQKAKDLENRRRIYDALSPEKKAEIIARRKARYQENKERLREYQRERYHKMKNKENECK